LSPTPNAGLKLDFESDKMISFYPQAAFTYRMDFLQHVSRNILEALEYRLSAAFGSVKPFREYLV